MRLTPAQIDTIKSTTSSVLGEGARVMLFGSRLHDLKKGGDVDLYVEVQRPELMQNIRCKVELQDRLDLPVDLIVKPLGDNSPISLIAKKEGVFL
jgi:predicted nucleotidyltransferase